MWRVLDNADEVIKVVVNIEPTQLRFEDPMKSFTEKVEKKGRYRETKWETCFLVMPAVHLKSE